MIRTKCKPDPEQWHRYYAWWPVYFYKTVGNRICWTMVWFDWVERKGERRWDYSGIPYFSWEYRMVTND